jgi:hypothetical protein
MDAMYTYVRIDSTIAAIKKVMAVNKNFFMKLRTPPGLVEY